MRVLLDNNLSARLIPILAGESWDVVHVGSVGVAAAADDVVMEAARQDDRILISADTDFGALLAASHASHSWSWSGGCLDAGSRSWHESWPTCPVWKKTWPRA